MAQWVFDNLYLLDENEAWSGVIFEPNIKETPTGEDIRHAVASIYQSLANDQTVGILCKKGVSHTAIFTLAYLIAHQGMALADAFLWLSNCLYTTGFKVPYEWLYAVVNTYQLPYSQTEIFDEHLSLKMALISNKTLHHITDGIHITNLAILKDSSGRLIREFRRVCV